MSKEAVIDFFKAIAADPAMHAQLGAADSPSTVVKLAKQKGFEFNEAEYAAVMEEMTAQDKEELDDSELKAFAGGGGESQDWAERQKKLIERYGYDN
ncbi:MAG: Nif11-like leader peptide family natural product precursor [Chroococcidiopsidaceae cyanobacterium CP_BM_ER_R8_30]|nr:Nif11-like leader peptide family natural product precursor [Chroococcidiopsidaceae cyanobacterium CP_BM_ER_R8_30]